MRTEPRYFGPPSRWIARDGRPAACLGDVTDRSHRTAGLPAFEMDSAEGGFVVFETLIAMLNNRGGLMMFPRWYSAACDLAPEGLVPLSYKPDARRMYRPWLFERDSYGGGSWTGQGSQRELDWRHMFHGILSKRKERGRQAGVDVITEMRAADRRAEAILLENLSPTQRLDWKRIGRFRVIGGATGNMYAVRQGNGFAALDAATAHETASYCLHPEGWMPDADVSLAHKLNLENAETEVDCLERARGSREAPPFRAQPHEKLAYDMEKHYALV